VTPKQRTFHVPIDAGRLFRWLVATAAAGLLVWAAPIYWLHDGHLPGFSLGWAMLTLWLLGVSIPVHEWIHAAAWVASSSARWEDLCFGFAADGAAAYTHCSKPMTMRQYRMGAVAPGLLLGVVPGLLGLWLGSYSMAMYAVVMTASAAGDLYLLWYTAPIRAEQLVLDHPQEMGLILVSNPNEESRLSGMPMGEVAKVSLKWSVVPPFFLLAGYVLARFALEIAAWLRF